MAKIKCPGCGATLDTETGLAELEELPPAPPGEDPPEPDPLPHPAGPARVRNRYRRGE